jgi:hypothetical protein
VSDLLRHLTENGDLYAALGLLSAVSLVGTVLVLPLLVVRIPPDYFLHRHREASDTADRHPLVHHALVIGKNFVGLLLVAAGLAMLVLPGQGLLTLLVGLLLTDFPGKYALEKRIVRQPGVLAAMNWLRARAGHPPVEAPP